MRTPRATYFHLEGVARTIAAHWLTEQSLLVCSSTGAIELQARVSSPSKTLYRFAQGSPRLCKVGSMTVLSTPSEPRCELLTEGKSGLSAHSISFPEPFSGEVLCSTPELPGLVAVREGEIFLSQEFADFKWLGQLEISGVTAACALSDDCFVFGSAHGEIEVFNKGSSTSLRRRAHGDAIQSIVRLDACTFVTVSRDRALRAWLLSDQIVASWSIPELHDHFINCALVVGGEIWTGSSDGSLAVTSIGTRASIARIAAHSDSVRSIDASPSGRQLVTVSDDGTYCILDVKKREVRRRFGAPRQYNRSGAIAAAEDGVNIAFGSTSGVLQYGSADGLPFGRRQIADDAIRTLQILPAGDVIVGEDNGNIRVASHGSTTAAPPIPTGGRLTVIRQTRDGTRFLCGYRDGSVRVYSYRTLLPETGGGSKPASSDGTPPLLNRRVHDSIVGDLLELQDGGILSCSDDHTIRTLSSDTLAVLSTKQVDNTAVNNLLPVGTSLVATTDGGLAVVLDLQTHEVLRRYKEHQGPVRAAAQVKGDWVATGDRAGTVRVWNIKTMATLCAYQFKERVLELGFDPKDSNLFVITESEVASLQLPTEWFVSSAPSVRMEPISNPKRAVDVFVSYSHTDEALKKRLESHLSLLRRQGRIQSWSDRHIDAGEGFSERIRAQLLAAEIVLLLVSPDFIASNYCYETEMEIAIARHGAGTAKVVPVILRPTDWMSAPFGQLMALPTDGRPVTSWPNEDDAFLDVAAGLRRLLDQMEPGIEGKPAIV